MAVAVAAAAAPAVVVAFLLPGCGDMGLGRGDAGEDAGPLPPDASLIIENQSLYELLEVRVHSTPEDYRGQPNLLYRPLGIGETFLHRDLGSRYVTVIRERHGDGRRLAFTTARALFLERGRGYRLVVHDESFRFRDDEPYIPPEGRADPGDLEGGDAAPWPGG